MRNFEDLTSLEKEKAVNSNLDRILDLIVLGIVDLSFLNRSKSKLVSRILSNGRKLEKSQKEIKLDLMSDEYIKQALTGLAETTAKSLYYDEYGFGYKEDWRTA